MAWGDIFPAIQGGIVDGAICCTKSATYSVFAKCGVGSHYIRKSGEKMGEIEYALNVAGTAYIRGYQVGKRFPNKQKPFVFYTALTLAIVAVLAYFNPIATLFLFVLPMIDGLLLTTWATYEHHARLSTENEFEASRNNLNRFYNITTGNLGYHTAHHHKQGVHWSLLPGLHEKIKDKISAHLITYSAL